MNYYLPDFDAAVEAGARNAYAKIHKTNGPYHSAEYASRETMQTQHDMALFVIEGFLTEMGKQSINPDS